VQCLSLHLSLGAGEFDLSGVHSFESATALDVAHVRALLKKLTSVSERVLQRADREQPGYSPTFVMYAPYRHICDMGSCRDISTFNTTQRSYYAGVTTG
jgi:hypothetical protein